MPTLESPQKAFGFSRKPYASYFSQPQSGYGVPANADPYGQIGMEERKLQAEQKVMQVLGELDAIEQSKRTRSMQQQYAPQIQALQREQFIKPFRDIGADDRRLRARQDVTGIDWTTEQGRQSASRLAQQSPEHAAEVADAFSIQSKVSGPDLFGEESRREQRAVSDYMAELPPSLRNVAQKSGGKTLAEIKGAVDFHSERRKTEAEMASIGIDPSEFKALEGDDGGYDPVKVNARKYKQEIANRDRPMTEKERQKSLTYAQRGLIAAAEQIKEATDAADDDLLADAMFLREQAIAAIEALGGATPKPRAAPRPTDDEKISAFQLKYKKPPETEAEWSMAYNLAAAAKQGAGAPTTLTEFQVTAKTTRAEIEKLPSGTRVVMPDGTSKIKK